MPEKTNHYTSKEVIAAYSIMLFKHLVEDMSVVKKNTTYNTDTEYIFYISYGYATIMHNGKIFSVSKENEFIGLHNIFSHVKCPISLTMRDSSKESIIYKIEKEKALKIIDEKNLYKTVSYLLHDRLYNFCFYLDVMTKTNSYEKIRIALEHYEKNQNIITKSVSLTKYLIDITRTSKSRVSHIISELKKGEYLKIDENGWITILRKLPNKF
ncbi:helix-turn-helix domain-containing protein [Enterobacter ludwigii]|nr:helix-turn-helix domain-containing protein [Enterobacter ludwigii]